MNKAVDIGQAYIDAVNNKDIDTLLANFAEDGVLNHPFGKFEGHDKISEFYTGLVFHADTDVSLVSKVGDDSISAFELIGVSPQAPDDPQYACDIFKLNGEGKIESLTIYYLNTAGS